MDNSHTRRALRAQQGRARAAESRRMADGLALSAALGARLRMAHAAAEAASTPPEHRAYWSRLLGRSDAH